MNQRNTIYIVIFLVLAGIAALILFKGQGSNALMDETTFATPDTASLQKIILSNSSGKVLVLTRGKDGWIMNDSLKAMPVKMDFMLKTLTSLSVLAPVSEASMDRTQKEITRGLKIQLFTDKDGKPSKTLLVGSMMKDGAGNYMAMTGENGMTKPYSVHISGFAGDIAARFLLEEAELRDLNVFDYTIDDISSVTVRYPYHPLNSFKLTVLSKDSFSIASLNTTAGDTLMPSDIAYQKRLAEKKANLSKPRVNDYLNSFKFLNAESFENNYIAKDSILATRPVALVYVQSKNGQTDSMTVYSMPANRRTKNLFDASGKDIKIDPDRYFATFNDGKDFGIIQQFVFGKILRSRNDFYIYE
ncbi:MAG: hypothetical protein SFW35_03985 [Chitinophagales bacterium]|nr:hypothetical protein [Chitinophagales bacterium]